MKLKQHCPYSSILKFVLCAKPHTIQYSIQHSLYRFVTFKKISCHSPSSCQPKRLKFNKKATV